MKIEKVNLGIKYGDIVIFENDGEFIGVGGSGKDENGDYRHSSWHKSIEEVLQNIGNDGGYSQEDSKENLKTWKYIKSIPWALSDPIPEGTKVLISDNAEDECEKRGLGWNGEMEEMIGKVCEIKEDYGGDCRIWNKDKSDWWYFPRQAFTIAVEEEESLGIFKDADKIIAKFNDALVDMGLEVKKIKE